MFPALVLLALACSGTAVAGSIVCYECTNVANISDCHTTRECPQYHSCFTSVTGQGSSAVFTLGCRHADHCPSTHQLHVPVGLTIVGRSVVSAACNQCCNVDACNRNMCSMTTHASGTDTDQCSDDSTFDCPSAAAHLNFCALTEQATAVCRKFCGLCSRNGSWSAWGQWSVCDVTCGSGHMTRLRSCTHPAPAHGGRDCEASATDNKPCQLPLCPVHGGWTLWSPWGSCSSTCGVGLRRRDRSCTNPYPSHGGDNCIGDTRDDKVCMDQPCADGVWTAWDAWGQCSTSCGPGFKTRARSCTNPPPSPYGRDCVGLPHEVAACSDRTCPGTSTYSGSTYVRWGRTVCPGNGTTLAYSGYMGGGKYMDPGAAANHICLTADPIWDHYDDTTSSSSKVYGVEYQFSSDTRFFGTTLFDHDPPCAVCHSARSASMMIPGRNRCMPGWTKEYSGYLVAGGSGFTAATEYICLDRHPESIPDGGHDDNGNLLYLVESSCGASLKCPPYFEYRELTCVVCTK